MLPPGLSAQPAEPADQRQLRSLHPAAQTAARLRVGNCSCDLVRAREAEPRLDERHHRERFRRAGLSREEVIAALERHRRGAGVPVPSGGWPRALAGFVAEHARNAGDTLYLLRFSGPAPPAVLPATSLHASAAVARPEGWLAELVPVLVQR
jgi:hypothetical protein